MSDQPSRTGETILVLLVGAAIGAAAGLLLAPRPGRETRRKIHRWIEDVEETLRGEDGDSLWAKGEDFLRAKAGDIRDSVESAARAKADAVADKVRDVFHGKRGGSDPRASGS